MAKTDALGGALVIGNLYGYASNSNGVTTVVLGTLNKINDKLVSLNVLERRHALYEANTTSTKIEKPTVSVKANMLFPITIYQVT